MPDTAPDQANEAREQRPPTAAKQWHGPGLWRRVGNAITGLLARVGIGPVHLLKTRGRKTGQLRTNPVVPVEHAGKRWLVAPYGTVSWVHNARAAGRVSLRHGRTTRDYAIREVSPDEAGPRSSSSSSESDQFGPSIVTMNRFTRAILVPERLYSALTGAS